MSAAESLRALLNATPPGYAVVPDDTLLVMLDVIDAATLIRGVAEWRDRDNAGPGVVVEAMADVVRLANALEALS